MVEPGPGVGPVPVRRGRGNAEQVCGVFDGTTREVAQLDQLRLDGFDFRETAQRFVELQQTVERTALLEGRGELQILEFEEQAAAAQLFLRLVAMSGPSRLWGKTCYYIQ